jgi:pimeloyl-ACP methyl ester carboxylesterase
MPETSAKKLDAREQHYWIPGPHSGLQLFLRHLAPEERPDPPRVVLYVHGATFPSALSIAHRFDGYSWRDCLCQEGFDVWGVDFHGFGHSDRYLEMEDPPNAHPPLCRAPDASDQIAAAVRFILDQHSVQHLSIIAHSWGSIAAGRFAGQHPPLVDRLVLFAPAGRPAATRLPRQRLRGGSLLSKINGIGLSRTFPPSKLLFFPGPTSTNGENCTSTRTQAAGAMIP